MSAAQYRPCGCYQPEHPIHVFPHDLSARYCLTSLMQCCLSLKVAFRPILSKCCTLYSFCLKACLGQYVFLFVALFIFPLVGVGDAILLHNTVIQWFSSSRSKSQRDSPALFFPQREMSGHYSCLLSIAIIFACVWDCVLVNMCVRAHVTHVSAESIEGVTLLQSTYLLLSADQLWRRRQTA